MAASLDLLDLLHKAVGEGLLSKIQSGEAVASDYAQAIKFLKDNGIEAVPTESGYLSQLSGSLKDRLPFSDPEDPVLQ